MKCPHKHTTSNHLLSLRVDIPRRNDRLMLQECIRRSSCEVTPAGYICDGCGTIDSVAQITKLKDAPQNLIVSLVRTDHNGKILTKVCPNRIVRIGTWSGMVNYEVRSFVEHTGTQ